MPRYFEFEVSLRGVRPKIWRRFLLATGRTTFHDLHEAIQEACGWWNYHMFLFCRRGRERDPIAGIRSDRDMGLFEEEDPAPDARKVKLNSFFSGTQKSCLYEYDFGNGWEHELKLVREVDLPETFRRRLVGGERAFPHEDSGGLSGYQRYAEFVRTGKDPLNEDPGGIRKWLDGWHPDGFDLKTVKAEFDQERAEKRSRRAQRRGK